MLRDPGGRLREAIRRQVRAVFNDTEKGERPVQPSSDALYPPGSVVRKVHADVVSMMVGGIAALLLQMLHPAALRGVLDHSNFRENMRGRLRQTARFIAVTTYGERSQAEEAIARVRAIHVKVTGQTADGHSYAASDPWLLGWVHVAEAISFLSAYRRYVDPQLGLSDQDRYFAEAALVAEKLGAAPVPRTLGEAKALLGRYRGELRVDADTLKVARLVLRPAESSPAEELAHSLLARAAVDELPHWARAMLELDHSGLRSLPNRFAVRGAARTLRWAFRG